MRVLATSAIRFYRSLLSSLLHRALAGGWWGCRYVPTCSRYCQQAVRQYGLRVGFVLFLRRLARCHPWAPGGYDPVPRADKANRAHRENRVLI